MRITALLALSLLLSGAAYAEVGMGDLHPRTKPASRPT
jgi:hypothetical protein